MMILQRRQITLWSQQDIIRVEGIDDVKEYNQYDQMNLFTDLPQKIKVIKASIKKNGKP